jgi:hypothetical protein
MNNYKLIKLKEGYIIVSDIEIEENDYCLDVNSNIIFKCSKNKSDGIYDTKDSWVRLHKNCKKKIASTFIDELPDIDFNNLEEKFGIVDVDDLALKLIGIDQNEVPHWNDFISNDILNIAKGFKAGFNKCLELNKDKLYTEEDVLDAWEKGAKEGLPLTKTKKDKLLKSLQPKTEWDIEIELETKCYCGHTTYCESEELEGKPYIQRPKITNNKIKILKV